MIPAVNKSKQEAKSILSFCADRYLLDPGIGVNQVAKPCVKTYRRLTEDKQAA
jgi:hypothetical protein